MQKLLYPLSIISLVMVLLVVLAGSIVRMTGSGMGCPDWPKCFGYYIPPTDVETLTWSAGREFKAGQMILLNDGFYTALNNHTAAEVFDHAYWERYTRHDYAEFNPLHTWIEYINRLLGALSGLPILAFFMVSLFYVRRISWLALAGGIGVFLLGFAAWLGKLVVDGNLIPHSITYHMFSALALVALFSLLTAVLGPYQPVFKPVRDARILWLGGVAILLLTVQVALGTEVRESIDTIASQGTVERTGWVDLLSVVFKVHRSFSILVLGTVSLFAFSIIRTRTISAWPRVLLVLVVFEIIAGMGLAYLGMPAALQPLHLVLAVLSFALLVFLLASYYRRSAGQAG